MLCRELGLIGVIEVPERDHVDRGPAAPGEPGRWRNWHAAAMDDPWPLLEAVKALLENYRIWAPSFRWGDHDPQVESSVLYDALAVALSFDESFCRIDEVGLEVTDEGFTRRSSTGSAVRVALEWKKERGEFEEFLVDRLLH